MPPHVVAVAGPLNGRAFPLAGPALSVGRAPQNDLPIQDSSISRQHCVIAAAHDDYVVRDLRSRNGTYVNGLPIEERALHHGDEIQIGHSVLVFVRDIPAIDGTAVPGDEATIVNAVAHSARLAAVAERTAVRETSQAVVDAATRLDAMVRITSILTAIRGLATLGRPLLALLAEVIPARRGIIVLGTRSRDAETAVTWSRDGEDAEPAFDRVVLKRVTGDAAAVLAASGAGATMAAPLRVFDRVLGAIMLEGDAGALTNEHLEFLTVVGSVAGLAVQSAREVEWLEQNGARDGLTRPTTHQMVGQSAQIRHLVDFIMKVAPTGATTLVRGESGTGKELVARAIHRNSGRASKPFVAINCAALTESLIESELFGYEKGAFTGAIARRAGKLEAANGGTVFLDEVGELPAGLQAKLLRVLQEREFERLGGTQAVKVDVRIVAATNRDLERAVADGSFRRDLYYRLNVVSVTLAPLRERREDILPLAKHFAARHAEKCGREVVGIAEDAATCLTTYEWPGNVRELDNAIERAVVLGTTPMILAEDLGEAILDAQPEGASGGNGFHASVRRAKRELILRAFEQAAGSHAEAARLLDLQPTYLHRLTRVLNLRPLLKTRPPRA